MIDSYCIWSAVGSLSVLIYPDNETIMLTLTNILSSYRYSETNADSVHSHNIKLFVYQIPAYFLSTTIRLR